MKKLWGGRFEGGTNSFVEEFTTSLGEDARLWEADIRLSQAHARMLGETGVLPAADAGKIVDGLARVRETLGSGSKTFDPKAEDIHSEIERLLGEEIGPLAGKLHTARSRNDQVATATRLYLRGEIDALVSDLRALERHFVVQAENHVETILPGMTHLQHAQPVSLAHHLLAYFWMLERDIGRLLDCRKRVNQLPLGAAALAGTSFPIDRAMVAAELGFEGICENSLDAVSDRDFAAEFLGAAALLATHLSRLGEEITIWNTPEFGFVELADAVATGSSIMPQKKNPDVAELVRGRTGRAVAALMGTLTTLKGLPLSYNRDLQEDKKHLFDGLDNARACVRAATILLEGTRFRADRMREALRGDFSNATDLADYLAKKGVPFRDAHEVVGLIVRDCLKRGRALEDLSAEELRAYSAHFGRDAVEVLPHAAVMAARQSRGGAAPSAVREQLARAKKLLA
jgi:argininosuccinate lyase